jgi:hypothetical protein
MGGFHLGWDPHNVFAMCCHAKLKLVIAVVSRRTGTDTCENKANKANGE